MSDWLSIAAGLTPNQRIILTDILGPEDCFGYSSFVAVAKQLDITRDQAREEMLGLVRGDLLTFSRGLWTENGEPYGSGYALNGRGVELVKHLEAVADAKLRAWCLVQKALASPLQPVEAQ